MFPLFAVYKELKAYSSNEQVLLVLQSIMEIPSETQIGQGTSN